MAHHGCVRNRQKFLTSTDLSENKHTDLPSHLLALKIAREMQF